MLPVGHLFIIEEGIYNDTKEVLSKYFHMNSVKEFIDLSKKVVKDGIESLSEKEQKTYRGLFEDPAIQDYIAAARRAGERDGWIYATISGGVGGAIGGAISGGVSTAIVLAVLGAAAGGAILGWPFSKAMSWIRKWRAEDDVIKLGRVGGVIGKTTPIVRAD